MPIRTLPFSDINAGHIDALQVRQVREDRTLEFKRDLSLVDRDTRSEFLKDLTALANSSGGTLVYGIGEGIGNDAGLAMEAPGLDLEPEAVHQLIDYLLRDSVDERLSGVLHRAVPRPDGRYYYIVRVPASPLAPHMVMLGKHSGRFFMRGNTTTYPMDATQIKETALRSSTAVDRATSLIADRQNLLRRRANEFVEDGGLLDSPGDDVSQLMLHVVPLFPAHGGFPLAEDKIAARLGDVPVFGWRTGDRRYALDGLHINAGSHGSAAYLRSGAVEFYRSGLVARRPSDHGTVSQPGQIKAWELEQDILHALDQCAGLTTDGLLPLPVVIAVAVGGAQGSSLIPSPMRAWPGPGSVDVDVASFTPAVLHAWNATAADQVRMVFDEVYQAWGISRSPNYQDGKRVWWNEVRVPAPKPTFWADGWAGGF